MWALGTSATLVLTWLYSLLTDKPDVRFYSRYNSLTVLMETVGVFMMIKTLFCEKRWAAQSRAVLEKLSAYTFGVYLVHMFVLNLLSAWGIHARTFNAAFSIPIIVFLTYLISLLISSILNHIPVVKKYIV